MIERNEFVTEDEDMTIFLKQLCIPIFQSWMRCEENLTPEVKTAIANLIENGVWLSSNVWKDLVKTQATIRLFRNCDLLATYPKLKNLKQPTLILLLSNAPAHILRQKVISYHTSQSASQTDEEWNSIAAP